MVPPGTDLPGQCPGSRGGGPPDGVSTRQHVWVFGGRGVRCPLHVLAPVPASLHTGSLQVPKPPSLLLGGGPARLPVRPGPGPRCSGASLLCGDTDSVGDREDSHPSPATDPRPTWHTEGAQYISLGGQMPPTAPGLWLCLLSGDSPGVQGDGHRHGRRVHSIVHAFSPLGATALFSVVFKSHSIFLRVDSLSYFETISVLKTLGRIEKKKKSSMHLSPNFIISNISPNFTLSQRLFSLRTI